MTATRHGEPRGREEEEEEEEEEDKGKGDEEKQEDKKSSFVSLHILSKISLY